MPSEFQQAAVHLPATRGSNERDILILTQSTFKKRKQPLKVIDSCWELKTDITKLTPRGHMTHGTSSLGFLMQSGAITISLLDIFRSLLHFVWLQGETVIRFVDGIYITLMGYTLR